MEEYLTELRAGVDQAQVKVLPVEYRFAASARRKMVDWSVLRAKLEEMQHVDWSALVNNPTAGMGVGCYRAIGCMMGMTLGDSVGAPLEFTPACSLPVGHPQRKAWVEVDAATESLNYVNEKNSFGLSRGQWTDDASMGFCMAESMLARGGYEGGDVRVRFFCWWFFGYCNAFRHAEHKVSVGLGGNIGKSMEDLVLRYTGKTASEVPPRFGAQGEDAGNGSLMRLAPIPVRYHGNQDDAMQMAEESSYATHPGPDAANCCRFVAFFVTQAIHRESTAAGDDIARFTDRVIANFIALEETRTGLKVSGTGSLLDWLLGSGNPRDASMRKLVSLLRSSPPTSKEACWNWKAKQLAVEQTLANRGYEYNGYPVSARYFGSYCMDGLAMALWALVHSTSLTDCIVQVVNLCGDADTTASIAGQMAGAFYGYQSLVGDVIGRGLLKETRQWDPLMEIELRALLLYRDGLVATNTKI